MSPALFKIVLAMLCLLSGSMFFDKIFIMIQGFEIIRGYVYSGLRVFPGHVSLHSVLISGS